MKCRGEPKEGETMYYGENGINHQDVENNTRDCIDDVNSDVEEPYE